MLWVDVMRAGGVFDAAVHLVLIIRWIMMARDGEPCDPSTVRVRRVSSRPIIEWGGSRVLLNPTGLTLDPGDDAPRDLPGRIHAASVRHGIQRGIRLFLREHADNDNVFVGALRDHLIVSGWAAWRCPLCAETAARIEMLSEEAGFIAIEDWVDLASSGGVDDAWVERARGLIGACREAIDPHTALDSVRSRIAGVIIRSVVSSATYDEARDTASRSVLTILRFSPKFSVAPICRLAWDLHYNDRTASPVDGDGLDVDVLLDVLLELLNQCLQEDRTPLLNQQPIDDGIAEWLQDHHPVHRKVESLKGLLRLKNEESSV